MENSLPEVSCQALLPGQRQGIADDNGSLAFEEGEVREGLTPVAHELNQPAQEEKKPTSFDQFKAALIEVWNNICEFVASKVHHIQESFLYIYEIFKFIFYLSLEAGAQAGLLLRASIFGKPNKSVKSEQGAQYEGGLGYT